MYFLGAESSTEKKILIKITQSFRYYVGIISKKEVAHMGFSKI